MTSSVMYLENQKAKMIGFSDYSDAISREVEINNTNGELYYNELADSMESSSEVLLLGPDDEKRNFRNWLITHRRNIGKKLVAVIPAQSISSELAKKYRKKYLH